MKNRGFTFVEMLLAIAMSSIIALGIGYMMQSSSENYTGVQTELSLQSDAQIIMNTISNHLLEANNAYYNAGLHLLTIYHGNESNRYPQELIWHDTVNSKIYIYQVTGDNETDDATYAEFTNLVTSMDSRLENYLLGINISSFECDQTESDGLGNKTTVTITINMSFSDTEYKLQSKVHLRNRIIPI